MQNLETCVVVNGKIYCWDEDGQTPKEADLVLKKTTGKIPKEALNALLLKMYKTRHLASEN